jgi:hydrogenase 3 maturation protease
MRNQIKNLKKRLKAELSGATSVVVLGVGSELLGDDAAGIMAACELERSFRKKDGSADLKVIIGDTAPENFTGEIKKREPSHLIIVDCADMGLKPGDVAILELEDIGGISFSIHRLPLSIMLRYLRLFVDCGMTVIGIQPRSLAFCGKPSKEAEKAAHLVADTVLEAISTGGAAPRRKKTR